MRCRTLRIPLLFAFLLAVGCEVKPVPRAAAPQAVEEIVSAVAETSAPDVRPTADSGNVAPEPEPADSADDAPRPAESGSGSGGRFRTILWDFGTIPPGTQAKHQFAIVNDDSRKWTIKRVAPSCACTVGEFSAKEIKPAATSALEVVFRGAAKQGLIHQAIVVEFQEPRTPVFNLMVQGEISDSLSAVPPAVKFGRLTEKSRLSRTFEFRNNSAHDVAITTVEAPDWLRVERRPLEVKPRPNGPRQKWEITIHADPAKLKPGSRTGMVVISSSSKDLEPVRVPVSLHVNAPLEPIPSTLTFNPVASGQATQKTFLLAVSSELGGLTEKDLVVTHDFGDELNVRISRKVARDRFLVVGDFRPKRSPGQVKGEVEIRAKGRDVEPARVVIQGEVR